jgi:biopolymer transport protein ExbD
MKRIAAALLYVAAFSSGALASTSPSVVTVEVLRDGSVQIEGQRFSDGEYLKAKLDEIAHRKPKPEVIIGAGKDADFKSLEHLILLLQQAGVAKIGFLIEPRPTKPQQ